jgi:hypothetical protein
MEWHLLLVRMLLVVLHELNATGPELPAEASLLVGHNHAFEKRFRYPRWKPAG